MPCPQSTGEDEDTRVLPPEEIDIRNEAWCFARVLGNGGNASVVAFEPRKWRPGIPKEVAVKLQPGVEDLQVELDFYRLLNFHRVPGILRPVLVDTLISVPAETTGGEMLSGLVLPVANKGTLHTVWFDAVSRDGWGDAEKSRNLAAVAYQIVIVLKAMHQLGLIHRDLKPENILVHKEGSQKMNLRISDFGYMTTYMLNGKHVKEERSKGQVMGTWRYASLFAHEGYAPSRTLDMGSFTYSMVYLYRGCLPWVGVKDKAAVQAAKSRISAEELTKECPAWLQQVAAMLLALDFADEPPYDDVLEVIMPHIPSRHKRFVEVDLQATRQSKRKKLAVEELAEVMPVCKRARATASPPHTTKLSGAHCKERRPPGQVSAQHAQLPIQKGAARPGLAPRRTARVTPSERQRINLKFYGAPHTWVDKMPWPYSRRGQPVDAVHPAAVLKPNTHGAVGVGSQGLAPRVALVRPVRAPGLRAGSPYTSPALTPIQSASSGVPPSLCVSSQQGSHQGSYVAQHVQDVGSEELQGQFVKLVAKGKAVSGRAPGRDKDMPSSTGPRSCRIPPLPIAKPIALRNSAKQGLICTASPEDGGRLPQGQVPAQHAPLPIQEGALRPEQAPGRNVHAAPSEYERSYLKLYGPRPTSTFNHTHGRENWLVAAPPPEAALAPSLHAVVGKGIQDLTMHGGPMQPTRTECRRRESSLSCPVHPEPLARSCTPTWVVSMEPGSCPPSSAAQYFQDVSSEDFHTRMAEQKALGSSLKAVSQGCLPGTWLVVFECGLDYQDQEAYVMSCEELWCHQQHFSQMYADGYEMTAAAGACEGRDLGKFVVVLSKTSRPPCNGATPMPCHVVLTQHELESTVNGRGEALCTLAVTVDRCGNEQWLAAFGSRQKGTGDVLRLCDFESISQNIGAGDGVRAASARNVAVVSSGAQRAAESGPGGLIYYSQERCPLDGIERHFQQRFKIASLTKVPRSR